MSSVQAFHMSYEYKGILTLVFLFMITNLRSQHADRFQDEVLEIQQKYDTLWDASKETIVFTGSSSIRIWKNLDERFPDYQIVNTGFGGSQTSDLLMHSKALVLRFKPKKVFIYEGDNDIAASKKPKAIIATTREVIHRIFAQDPATQIVLISAKPSIARWDLKKHYKKLNRKFKRLSKKEALIEYADVWKPMLNGRKLKEELFIKDGLHMNAQGYAIWYDVLKNYVN